MEIGKRHRWIRVKDSLRDLRVKPYSNCVYITFGGQVA
jgi:hypothetical protein